MFKSNKDKMVIIPDLGGGGPIYVETLFPDWHGGGGGVLGRGVYHANLRKFPF